MGTLIEQIKELMGVLEIVDPEAAAALYTGQANRTVPGGGSRVETSRADVSAISERTAGMLSAAGGLHAPGSSDAAANTSAQTPLRFQPDRDRLIQGILYSEILGKPVSRRHRGRWI